MSRKAALRILGLLAAAIGGVAFGFTLGAWDYRAFRPTVPGVVDVFEPHSSLAPSDNTLDETPLTGQPKGAGR
jgi:hypothetical protein